MAFPGHCLRLVVIEIDQRDLEATRRKGDRNVAADLGAASLISMVCVCVCVFTLSVRNVLEDSHRKWNRNNKQLVASHCNVHANYL